MVVIAGSWAANCLDFSGWGLGQDVVSGRSGAFLVVGLSDL